MKIKPGSGLKAVLFDLDGTLLNTLDDLAESTNAALAAHGMPLRTTDEVRRFVGNGVKKLIERAVPEGTDEKTRTAVLDSFVAHYREHERDTTRPYEGISAMLEMLNARGVKCGVISNKIEPAVRALCAEYYGDLIQTAVGDAPGRPVKPDPQGVYEAMKRLGVPAEGCVYVGDSDVDIYTGHNAGLAGIGVTWGFRSEALLREAGADHICHTAQELLDLLLSM
ncbi:MAG: HAD family hydrolase [Clostridia bacterium]|nr:HAD family hydrolase [Clostridia bacterium]